MIFFRKMSDRQAVGVVAVPIVGNTLVKPGFAASKLQSLKSAWPIPIKDWMDRLAVLR
jgi:hypothetical protein